jgi:hypothetical protein
MTSITFIGTTEGFRREGLNFGVSDNANLAAGAVMCARVTVRGPLR